MTNLLGLLVIVGTILGLCVSRLTKTAQLKSPEQDFDRSCTARMFLRCSIYHGSQRSVRVQDRSFFIGGRWVFKNTVLGHLIDWSERILGAPVYNLLIYSVDKSPSIHTWAATNRSLGISPSFSHSLQSRLLLSISLFPCKRKKTVYSTAVVNNGIAVCHLRCTIHGCYAKMCV